MRTKGSKSKNASQGHLGTTTVRSKIINITWKNSKVTRVKVLTSKRSLTSLVLVFLVLSWVGPGSLYGKGAVFRSFFKMYQKKWKSKNEELVRRKNDKESLAPVKCCMIFTVGNWKALHRSPWGKSFYTPPPSITQCSHVYTFQAFEAHPPPLNITLLSLCTWGKGGGSTQAWEALISPKLFSRRAAVNRTAVCTTAACNEQLRAEERLRA